MSKCQNRKSTERVTYNCWFPNFFREYSFFENRNKIVKNNFSKRKMIFTACSSITYQNQYFSFLTISGNFRCQQNVLQKIQSCCWRNTISDECIKVMTCHIWEAQKYHPRELKGSKIPKTFEHVVYSWITPKINSWARYN